MVRNFLFILLLLPTTLLAASYTWNGGTSTDWNTAANWTPSGVPTSGDNVTIVSGTNQPLLDQARTIGKFTITSGTLTLNTYTLTAADTSSCSGGNVNNGTISFTGNRVAFSGTTFGATVTAACSVVYLNGSKFNSSATIEQTGSTGIVCNGGNVFAGSTIIKNSGTNYWEMANINPDTANSDITFLNTSSGQIRIGLNSANNVFNGNATMTNSGTGFISVGQYSGSSTKFNSKAVFNNTSSGTINISYGYSGNTTTFNDTAFLNNSSTGIIYSGDAGSAVFNSHVSVSSTTGGSIYIGYNGTASLTSGKNILIGSGGFSAGSLHMKNFTQNGSTAQSITLTGTAVLRFSSGSTFNGNVTGIAPRLVLDGTKFNGTATLEKNGATNDISTGGNVFNGTTTVTNSGSGYLLMANTTRDTCNAAATFISSGSGDLYVGYTGGTFNGTTTFTNTGTAMVRPAEISTCNFNENIIVNSTNGNGVQFHRGSGGGNPTLASGKTITVGASGFSAGSLWFEKFIQSGTTAQSFTLTGSATLVFGINCTFNAGINFTAPRILMNTGTFNGAVVLEMTGGSNSPCTGGNIFNSTASFKNSGTASFQLAVTNPDDFNADATFIKTGSGALQAAYSGNNTFAGNITATGAVTFNASTGTVNLDGSTVQTVSGDNDFTFYNLTLSNTGVKTFSRKATVTNVLAMGSSAMSLGTNEVYLSNMSASAALTRTTGYSTNANTGKLTRKTNTTNIYIFPIVYNSGSMLDSVIVRMTLDNTRTQAFSMGLYNNYGLDVSYDQALYGTGITENVILDITKNTDSLRVKFVINTSGNITTVDLYNFSESAYAPLPVEMYSIVNNNLLRINSLGQLISLQRAPGYAHLSSKPDGGYTKIIKGKLYFRFEDEYVDPDEELSFKIYDKTYSAIAGDAGYTILTNNGDNRFALQVGCILDGLPVGYYMLEVSNVKNEKSYLRFYNGDSIACPMSNDGSNGTW